MKCKNLVLSGITVFTLFFGTITTTAATTNESVNVNQSCVNSLQNGLQSNQTILFYMYSNETGHYLLDPLTDIENVIFVGHNDFPIVNSSLHHGKRFIGTFVDDTLWELTNLQEVFYDWSVKVDER